MNVKTISDIFEKSIYRIPDYQRGYAWGKNQILDIWRDLSLITSDTPHFTGAITVKNITDNYRNKTTSETPWINDGYKCYSVIDGQQRLTTIIILLSEIIKTANEKGIEKLGETESHTIINCRKKYLFEEQDSAKLVKCYRFLYENFDDNNCKCFIKDIYNTGNSEYNDTLYTKHIVDAKKLVDELILNLKKEDLISLYHKITQRLVFEFRDICSVENNVKFDENEMFETMNNRGKPLTDLELLKNRLIFLTTKFHDETSKTELRKVINSAWKVIYEKLGNNYAAPLSDDEYLKFHYMYYFNDTNRNKGKVYKNRLFEDIFTIENILDSKTVVEIENNDDNYQENLDISDDFENDNIEDSDKNNNTSLHLSIDYINEYVLSLKDIAGFWDIVNNPNLYIGKNVLTDSELEWLKKLKRLNIGRELFLPIIISSLSNVQITVNERIHLFQMIEKYIFISYYLMKYGKGTGINKTSYQKDFYNLANELKKNNIINKIIAFIAEKLENNIKNIKKNKFDAYDSLGLDGFYKWDGIYYLLYDYEEYLQLDSGYPMKIDWEKFQFKDKSNNLISIEHIYPQTPETDRRPEHANFWNNQFNGFNDEDKHIFSITLGNMLPLHLQKNRLAQNYMMKWKVEGNNEIGLAGYNKGSCSELEITNLMNENFDWDYNYIYSRGMHLIEYIEKRWDIKFLDLSEKIKFLLLDKVNVKSYTDIKFGGINDVKIKQIVNHDELNSIVIEFEDEKEEELTDDEEDDGTLTQKELYKKSYWEAALPIIRKAHDDGSDSYPYSHISAHPSNSSDGFFNIKNIKIRCKISSKHKCAISSIRLYGKTKEINNAIFDILYSKKDEIEKNVSLPIVWDRKDENKCCNIYVKLENVDYRKSNDIEKIADFHAKMSKELAEAIVYQYKDELINI